jgi:hypothetical protein
VLCAPAAARLSRHSAGGRGFSLPEWLMNVCHHSSDPRGTQRPSSQHPTEPLNAVIEQESRGDSQGAASPLPIALAEAIVMPAIVLLLISIAQASPVSDPAFRCTFLI